jgi:stage II sporulation protein D
MGKGLYLSGRYEMRKPLLVFTAIAILIVVMLPLILVTIQKARVRPIEGFRGIRVLLESGKIETMDLEDYLVGVVSAEMPASFETEALKAQAIAARTFAVKRLVQSTQQDQGYDVDTTQLTQAWISDAAMKAKWGTISYWPNKLKIERAVKDTKGLVLTYEGSYVQAFFFSSAGRLPTEKSEEVWGSPLPYLTNASPEEEQPERFVVTSYFTPKQLDAKLGTALTKKGKLNSADLTVVEKTSAGRAKTVKIGGKLIAATVVRTQLGLKSTDFALEVENNRLKITTYGNGHAVGMSQYGANSMADRGKKFAEILEHYYPGSSILNIDKPQG